MKERIEKMKNSKKKGFTLIELVVVIAILAILALIMVPNLTAYLGKAKEAKIQANMKNVHTASEMIRQTEGGLDEDRIKELSNNQDVIVSESEIADEDLEADKYTVTNKGGQTVVKYKTKEGKVFTFPDVSNVNNGETGETGENEDLVEMDNSNLYTYEPVTGGLKITGFNEEYIDDKLSGIRPTEIFLPNQHEGETVVSVGDYSFAGKQLVSVTIPDSIETIGERAFVQNKISLVDFSKASSLSDIEYGAFHVNQLTKLTLQGATNLKTIGGDAFKKNDQLVSVDFSGTTSLETIGRWAFGENNQLASVDFSGATNLKTIGEWAFGECGLISVDFSGATSLETIEEWAFGNSGSSSGGNKIETVNFSGATNLTTINQYAFSGNKITSVDFSDAESLETIGEGAFYINNLTEVNFSGATSLKTIGFIAFNQNKITSVDFSGNTNLTTIGNAAFLENQITLIKVPDSVTSIGNGAFNVNTGGIVHANLVGSDIWPTLRGYKFEEDKWTMQDLGN